MSESERLTGKFIPFSGTEFEQVEDRVHYWYSKPGLTETEDLLFVRAQIPARSAHRFHYHPYMEEIIYVLSGEAEQWLDKEKQILQPGDSVHIPQGIVHGTYNPGDQPLEFLAILTPAGRGEPFLIDVFDREPWKSLRT